MAFFCRNAQEEALKEIAWQMKIKNELEMVHELHAQGGMSDELYIKTLREFLKLAK